MGHLRIDRVRIKPIQSKAPTKGGKAIVEAAIPTPAESPNSIDPQGTEYIAVKKLYLDREDDDVRVLAVRLDGYSIECGRGL